MFRLFDETHGVSVSLPQNADEAVYLAACDLVRDLQMRSGRKEGFAIAPDGAITVRTVAGKPESYTVTVSDGGIAVCATDTLGMVYGLYAISEKLLGFEPLFLFHDVLPEVTESLFVPAQVFTSQERKVRYRGWFINDEDLLTEWKIGGKRSAKYEFYQTVMHPDVLDMVLETMLRLELNLIIPSSLVDICNPPEEALVAASCRRGLYVTQHHVEPLGVSGFSAGKILGEDRVSYFQNPAAYEAVWAQYAARWAKYGKHVIWQLGLRGTGDVPVWESDPTFPLSPQERGKCIGKALSRQHEIVQRATGDSDAVLTLTLWNEMAELYRGGYLEVPPHTLVVFCDVGFDSMFGDDFYATPRREGTSYGIYYHLAFYGRGAHLCEGVSPEKMQFCFAEAKRMHSLDYAIINVSNIRPFVYSLALNAAQLRDPDVDVLAYARSYDARFFGALAPRISAGRSHYYRAMGELSETCMQEECANRLFSYHSYGKLPFRRFVLTDGSVRYYALLTMRGVGWSPAIDAEAPEKVRQAVSDLEEVLREWQELRVQIPQNRLAYYDLFLQGQTRYLLHMYRYAAAVLRRDGAAAAAEMRCVLQEREERGEKWKDWYRGEKKLNIAAMLEKARNMGRMISAR